MISPTPSRRLWWSAGLILCLCGAIFESLSLANPTSARPIDLARYHLVFEEDFSVLDVSGSGSRTKWIAHTPWHGDFGEAAFVDPQPGFPFGNEAGHFRIQMRRNRTGAWESGLLATNPASARSIAPKFGYFELRAKLPAGKGVWPAFWLDTIQKPASPTVEIDVMEHYGQFPTAYNTTVTVWPAAATGRSLSSVMNTTSVPAGSLSEAYHTYGVLVDQTTIKFYFDRLEVWTTPTPAVLRGLPGFTILVDLGLGGGWPIDDAPDPANMYLDYVRVYEKAP